MRRERECPKKTATTFSGGGSDRNSIMIGGGGAIYAHIRRKGIAPGLSRCISSAKAKTVDIGINIDAGVGGAREQHSGILVVRDGLASDADIDRAIDGIIAELNDVRAQGKGAARVS
jgi:hypothetical protein